MRLFPGPYIHLGGDEVVYSTERVALLQRAVAFVQSNGRSPVVWDDALAARLSKGVVIMSWRGEKTAQRAMGMGFDVVITPDGPLYFDAAQGAVAGEPPASPHMATLEEVYNYSPRSGVMGVQANVWTEKIATFPHLAYMTMPRELALAEISWDPARAKNWGSFLRRLPAQLAWLDRHGYRYRVPNTLFSVRAAHVKFQSVPGDPQSAFAFTDSPLLEIRLENSAPGSVIHYTVDERGRQTAAGAFLRAIHLRVENRARIEVRAVAVLPDGRHSRTTRCTIVHVSTSALARVYPYSRSWSALVSP